MESFFYGYWGCITRAAMCCRLSCNTVLSVTGRISGFLGQWYEEPLPRLVVMTPQVWPDWFFWKAIKHHRHLLSLKMCIWKNKLIKMCTWICGMQKEQIFRGPELIVSMSSETLMYKVQGRQDILRQTKLKDYRVI